MMKKNILAILLMLCAGAIFAQAAPAANAPETPKEKKNALALDLFPLLKGFIASDSDAKISYFTTNVSYERLVAPHFSAGADIDLTFGKWASIDIFYLGLSAEGRYYPMSEKFEKFFIGTTVGYNQVQVDGRSKPADGGFSGLNTSLKVGYKLIGESIYIEPSMSYVLSKSSVGGGLAFLFGGGGFDIPTPLGWQGGLRFGFMF